MDTSSPWSVYILGCADDTLYCGITRDLRRRLAQHNGLLAGGARYTRSRRPVRLLALTEVADRSSAQRLEAEIKRLPKARKVARLQEAQKLGRSEATRLDSP